MGCKSLFGRIISRFTYFMNNIVWEKNVLAELISCIENYMFFYPNK